MIADYRERHIIELLEKQSIEFESKNLEVGDFQLFKGQQLQFIIERKSLSDLENSIKTGRWREQKSRLFALPTLRCRNQVIFLIEGVSNSQFAASKTFNSCMTNTIVRDSCQVVRTFSTYDTVRFIQSLCKSLDKFELELAKNYELRRTPSGGFIMLNGIPLKKVTEATEVTDDSEVQDIEERVLPVGCEIYREGESVCDGTEKPVNLVNSVTFDYTDTIRIRKKDNNTPSHCYIMQLCCIPGVSTTIAKAIQERYTSIKLLIDELEMNGVSNLRTLKVGRTNRSIGPVVSQRILTYFIG